MIDNLGHNREKARSASKSKTHGFTYAIKQDGTLLGDELYGKRRQQNRPFSFLSSHESASLPRGPLHHRPENCLFSIQRLIDAGSSQYQQASAMPPAPVEAVPQKSASSHVLDKQFPPPSGNVALPPSITPSTSAPVAAHIVSYSNNGFSKTQSFVPPIQPSKENMHPNKYSSSSSWKGPDLDDDYDSLLADIDVDQVVSQRQSLASSTHSNNTTSGNSYRSDFNSNMNSTTSNRYSDANSSSEYGFRNDYSTNNATSRNQSNFGNASADFDYGQWDNTNDNANSSFSNGALSERVEPSYDNTFTAHGISSTYGAPSYDNDSAGHADGGFASHSDNFSAGHADEGFASHSNNYAGPPTNNTDTPLCPGHNLPCRALTANTATNMGRQFYKCSMPEGQGCDFFEWADGVDGSWNNNLESGGGPVVGGITKDMYAENQRIFGHRSFRPGQKDVIEQAITGRDVFVLMPTGGGKSLCYQLPAWCCPGLAVIISPLLSLIQDQVQSMTKVGVRSVFLSSKQDFETEQKDILDELKHNTTAHGGIKLLYLTPEKLSHSNSMMNILRNLYQRGLLSRFVVDEAHCLSDWGHDFRPDYNQLGLLRREFPNTPLMALTATANEKVVNDAIRALGMRNEYRYRSSFNRKNLHYEVRKKDGKVVDAIAAYIATKPRESGVVYCLSRKNCEDVARKLQEKLREKGCRGIDVSFYHANLDQVERDRRHHAWSIGRISVLCATIAFGMGIDKPDVRYVVHYSMPKSITHYYQESGRAGRDGEQADCILFYSYKDKKTLESMIRKSAPSPNHASTRRKIDQLYTCVRYCEDEFRCRRTMQLEFFGERFNRSKCNGTCDNCKSGKEPERRDMTNVAKMLLSLLTEFQKKRNGRGVTMLQVSELYRGSKTKSLIGNIDTGRLKGYGAGSKFKKYEIDRITHAMVFDRLFVEESTETNGGFSADYVQYGENAYPVLNGSRQFFVEFPKAQAARKTKIAKATTKKSNKKKPAAKASTGKRNSAGAAKTPDADNGLQFQEVGDSDDDDVLSASPFSANKVDLQMVLSQDQTKQLSEKIKKMTRIWALEEQEMGKNVHYWNILSVDVIKSVAHFVPTSLEELSALGVLGEAKLKEYGERLVKIVLRCLENELGLDVDFVKSKRPVKRAKVAARQGSGVTVVSKKKEGPDVIMIDDNDEFDEFDTGIDFTAIEIPARIAGSSTKIKSRHFG